ncbi:MAG: alpha/beta family hydrolase [Acidobacteriota bacterium]
MAHRATASTRMQDIAMQTFLAADELAPVLVFAHGAGAGQHHPWIDVVARGLAAHGVHVVTFDFPYMRDGRKLPDKGAVLEAAFGDAWTEAAASLPPGPTAGGPLGQRTIRTRTTGARVSPMFAGGKSMGGRIASQVTARGTLRPAPAGLVFFGYPLHPPGKPEQRRDRHLAALESPLLFLHGSKDPFGSPDEMRALTAALPRATLELIDGGDHSLKMGLRQDPAAQSLPRAITIAATWIKAAARTTTI